MTQPLLSVKGVSRYFGGLRAVDGVSFDVFPGEILGILGPNGAGKTVLFNLISGIYEPSSGEIWFSGERIDGIPPHMIAQKGSAGPSRSSSLLRHSRFCRMSWLREASPDTTTFQKYGDHGAQRKR